MAGINNHNAVYIERFVKGDFDEEKYPANWN